MGVAGRRGWRETWDVEDATLRVELKLGAWGFAPLQLRRFKDVGMSSHVFRPPCSITTRPTTTRPTA